MILAYQEGRKRQTRRVVRPDLWPIFEESAKANGGRASHQMLDFDVPCPYGEAGDELLLREPYRIDSYNDWSPRNDDRRVIGTYRADGMPFELELTRDEYCKLRARKFPHRAQPGRFMYRSLCRHRVRLTGVRVERLQEISGADAKTEGVYREWDGTKWWYAVGPDQDMTPNPRRAFKDLWNSINAKRGWGWDTNPWVWVLEFEPMEEE